MNIPPRIDYYGDKAKAAEFKGNALAWWTSIVSGMGAVKSIQRQQQFDNGMVYQANIVTNAYGATSGRLQIFVPINNNGGEIEVFVTYIDFNGNHVIPLPTVDDSPHTYGYMDRFVHKSRKLLSAEIDMPATHRMMGIPRFDPLIKQNFYAAGYAKRPLGAYQNLSTPDLLIKPNNYWISKDNSRCISWDADTIYKNGEYKQVVYSAYYPPFSNYDEQYDTLLCCAEPSEIMTLEDCVLYGISESFVGYSKIVAVLWVGKADYYHSHLKLSIFAFEKNKPFNQLAHVYSRTLSDWYSAGVNPIAFKTDAHTLVLNRTRNLSIVPNDPSHDALYLINFSKQYTSDSYTKLFDGVDSIVESPKIEVDAHTKTYISIITSKKIYSLFCHKDDITVITKNTVSTYHYIIYQWILGDGVYIRYDDKYNGVINYNPCKIANNNLIEAGDYGITFVDNGGGYDDSINRTIYSRYLYASANNGVRVWIECNVDYSGSDRTSKPPTYPEALLTPNYTSEVLTCKLKIAHKGMIKTIFTHVIPFDPSPSFTSDSISDDYAFDGVLLVCAFSFHPYVNFPVIRKTLFLNVKTGACHLLDYRIDDYNKFPLSVTSLPKGKP